MFARLFKLDIPLICKFIERMFNIYGLHTLYNLLKSIYYIFLSCVAQLVLTIIVLYYKSCWRTYEPATCGRHLWLRDWCWFSVCVRFVILINTHHTWIHKHMCGRRRRRRRIKTLDDRVVMLGFLEPKQTNVCNLCKRYRSLWQRTWTYIRLWGDTYICVFGSGVFLDSGFGQRRRAMWVFGIVCTRWWLQNRPRTASTEYKMVHQ